MPPKTKFNKEDTVEAAFRIVRHHGWEKLSARSIAAELGSSTMPVYSNLGSMSDLEKTIVEKALDLQLAFQKTPRTGDPILDLGLGYVLFAKHERHLFKAINDETHGQLQVKLGEKNFEFVVQALSQDARFKGMSTDQFRKLVFLWWVFVHGLANMSHTLALLEFDEAEIADCIQKAGALIMRGFLGDPQYPQSPSIDKRKTLQSEVSAMGFTRTFPEIMAMAGKRAEFYGAEMLTVTWETKPEIIKSLLPPPLKPAGKPIASAFVADYPRTNFSLPYREAALFLLAEYDGVEGGYCLSMPVTNDMAMAGGREVFGYPKKMADIHFDNRGDFVEGWVERHGVRYFQVKAELTGQPNDSGLLELLQDATSSGPEQERYAYNFKHFPSTEGQGFDYNPRLIRESVIFRPVETTIGKAEVVMNASDQDPWATIEVVKMLGAVYTKGDNTMQAGKVVAEVDPVQFAPHAFLRWDRFSGER